VEVPSPTNSIKIKTVLLTIVLFLLSVGVWTLSLLYSQNILYNNPNWAVSGGGSLQPVEILLARALLAENTLNLDLQNGLQEIQTTSSEKPRRISFHFLIHGHAFLDIFFNRNGATVSSLQSGIRLSGDEKIMPLYFEGNLGGEFSRSIALPEAKIDSSWHSAELSESGDNLSLQIDGGKPIRIPDAGFKKGVLSFKSGFFGASISQVDIDYDNGTSLHEKFRNTTNWLQAFCFNLGALALLLIFFLVFKRDRLSFAFRFASTSLAAACLWYSFDFLEISKFDIAPTDYIAAFKLRELNTVNPWNAPIAHIRYIIFDQWNRLAGGTRADEKIFKDKLVLSNPLPSAGLAICEDSCQIFLTMDQLEQSLSLPKTGYRFLVLGGSMTAGFGALDLEHTFIAQLQKRLHKGETSVPIKTINDSVQTAMTSFMDTFQQKVKSASLLRPDVILVGGLYLMRPSEAIAFEKVVLDWLKEMKKQNVRVIFMNTVRNAGFRFLEQGTYPTFIHSPSQQFDADLETLTAAANAITVSAEELLNDPKSLNTGLIWNEPYHLTSYGQKLLADWIAPKVLAAIKKHSPLDRDQ
jgi:hypothetical protein